MMISQALAIGKAPNRQYADERTDYAMTPRRISFRLTISLPLLSLLMLPTGLISCSGSDTQTSPPPIANTGTPVAKFRFSPRLFLETRFAQAFKVFLDNGGNANDPNIGDSVVEAIKTLEAPITPGPFKGLSMNCRTCHLVDDVLDTWRRHAHLCRLCASQPEVMQEVY
jgi:hypothetical protein